MEKDDFIASFFTKISQLRDQLLVIGITIDDDDLVQNVLDGLPSSWETFLAEINVCENQPDFERLWHDCPQEGGRIRSRNGTSKEESLALAARTRKGKIFTPQKKFPQKEKRKNSFKGKEFDMSKVKCFNCQLKGHFARDFPKIIKGNKGKYCASIVVEDESRRTKTKEASNNQETRREYYLISTLSGSLTNADESWLIDSGASRNMTGNK
jgi:hypothetical protein